MNIMYNNFNIGCSEYQQLKDICLFKPKPRNMVIHKNNNLLIENINVLRVHNEIENLAKIYSKHKINVKFLTPNNHFDIRKLINIIYMRDLFFTTPMGIIISNMSANLRRPETMFAESFFRKFNFPIIKIFDNADIFEGADALWINNKTVLIGVGKRTNLTGFMKIKAFLYKHGIKTEKCHVHTNLPQHLLGTLQIVDKNTAIIRRQIADPKIIKILHSYDYNCILIDENHEIIYNQAINLVTIAPRTVIIPDNCPNTEKLLLTNNINIADVVKIKEITKGGGGIACMTGILHRANI